MSGDTTTSGGRAALSARIVGVGDAFTTKHHNAYILIEADGTRLLVDAPPALARALADLGRAPRESALEGGLKAEPISLDDIDNVLITHLHGDHVGGLEQLLFWRRFVTGKKAAVYAIPDVLDGLWDTRLRGGMEVLMDEKGQKHRLTLDDYADVRPIADGGVTEIGALRVETRRTIHHIPTSALRVEASGRALGYSADTSFDRPLIEWLARADLFFHETNYGIHTPLSALAALPADLRDRMRLIHYPDGLDVDASPIPCAREGQRYAL